MMGEGWIVRGHRKRNNRGLLLHEDRLEGHMRFQQRSTAGFVHHPQDPSLLITLAPEIGVSRVHANSSGQNGVEGPSSTAARGFPRENSSSSMVPVKNWCRRTSGECSILPWGVGSKPAPLNRFPVAPPCNPGRCLSYPRRGPPRTGRECLTIFVEFARS